MDSTTRKGTNFNFTPRLYKVTIVKWISFMAFDGKHFFLSNVLMRKCWVLIMASSCWWPILRFILIGRFNLVCLVLTELMNCVLRRRFVTFPLHDLKGIDLSNENFFFFLSNVLIAHTVSTTVKSQAKDFPPLYGNVVMPSGLFLSVAKSPLGSQMAANSAVVRAFWMRLLAWLCLAFLLISLWIL